MRGGGGLSSTVEKEKTLRTKAFRLWKAAGLPKFLNKYGPKRTPGWLTYLCHLEYTAHAPAWRRAARFMGDYYRKSMHWTSWQKAILKWPQWVWDALAKASAGEEQCELAAIDGTTMSRSNPSQHYMKKIGTDQTFSRPIQDVIMIDVKRRKFLAWRIRAKPRGEKCDVPYLIRHSPVLPELILMDKGFDSEPLHTYLRDIGVWSVAPTKKNCKRGRYRKQLRDCFDWTLYWQRSLVECLISALKRLYGSHVRARNPRAQRAELNSRFIAYNLGAILITTFY
ncbi:MAG TPA: transposase [Candidatus Nanoarchaeia archaeon]|nr:transposase [Candidatus Nanoarchaeia archaeon]